MDFEWDEGKIQMNQAKHGAVMNERDEFLEKEFDFSKAVKNPYAKSLKKQVTINLDAKVVTYFKDQSAAIGIPYQTLINLYLCDCIKNHRQPEVVWKKSVS